jgi:CheY-like chemotaxis protein
MAGLYRPRGYPTVIVTEENNDSREVLVDALRREGYLVLEAHNSPSALDIVRTHSRPIHLLLINENADHRILAHELQEYRREMNVLFVGQPQHKTLSDVLTPEMALAKARAFFRKVALEPLAASGQNRSTAVSATQSDPCLHSLKAAG